MDLKVKFLVQVAAFACACGVAVVLSQDICDIAECTENQVCVREFLGGFRCKDPATQKERCSRLGFAGIYWRFPPCAEPLECRHLRCRSPRNRNLDNVNVSVNENSTSTEKPTTTTTSTTTDSPFTIVSNSSETTS